MASQQILFVKWKTLRHLLVWQHYAVMAHELIYYYTGNAGHRFDDPV